MERFFFDVSTKSHIRYDYRGRELQDLDQARHLAEMIALDVHCRGDDPDALEVQVRNVVGQQLFSIVIEAADAVAA